MDVHQLENHRIYYGNIKDGQEVIDECIVLIMKGPHSYTKEDVVEIDCHGGVTVVYKVLNLVLKNVRERQNLENLQREHFSMDELIYPRQKRLWI